MNLKKMTLNINGADRMFICDPAKDTLADVLRRLGLTGTKVGCGMGACGACSVILDGKVIRSCTRKISKVEEYSKVTTIEGIGSVNYPHPLQRLWVAFGAVQCGFCVPGFIVSSYQLLQDNPNPTREDVRDWFQKHRNVCRCTGYKQIVDTVMEAAAIMRGEKTFEKFEKGMRVSRAIGNLPVIGKLFSKTAFKELRENIFGESVQFMISGGSAISENVLEFFNAIGYHLANGYGMTEIGITSVELSKNKKLLNSGWVGRPFSGVEYKIEDGQLFVRG